MNPMGKEGFSLKKTIISLLLAMAFILTMSVSVFAGDYLEPYIAVKDDVEQAISK